MADKKIHSFKKFTELTKAKKEKIKEVDMSIGIDKFNDSDLPNNPNLSNNNSKKEVTVSTDDLKPLQTEGDNIDSVEEKVKTYGKVAKFPKNVKASKAYNFLENVKISKKSIWYIVVEKEENNELQVVKYNNKEGVDLNKFVNELKTYYLDKYSDNKVVCEAISKLNVDGNDNYSMIKGISLIELDGKKMVAKITEDLIKLLSK